MIYSAVCTVYVTDVNSAAKLLRVVVDCYANDKDFTQVYFPVIFARFSRKPHHNICDA